MIDLARGMSVPSGVGGIIYATITIDGFSGVQGDRSLRNDSASTLQFFLTTSTPQGRKIGALCTDNGEKSQGATMHEHIPLDSP